MNFFLLCNELFSADGQKHRQTDNREMPIVAFPDIGKSPCKWRQYKSMQKTHSLKEN